MATSEEAPSSELVNEPKTLDSTEGQIMPENVCGAESSGTNGNDDDGEGSGKTLEEAAEFMEKGSVAVKAGDYAEAAECFSRAVEIRVAHYGELAPECSSAYYKYGCALLYKAQEEADPLGSVPKKDTGSIQSSSKDVSLSKGECSASSAAGDDDSTHNEVGRNDEKKSASEVDQSEADDDDHEGSEDEDLGDEDESDLDLAWKMLDLSRAIVEKNPEDTIEKVDILSALGEVALEREDIETSLSDYLNALSILQRLVESDSRQLAELNFRICLALEVGSKPEEAITYCKKAISVCEARAQRLKDEVKKATDSVGTVIADDNQKVDQGPNALDSGASVLGKEAEIETLNGLLDELGKKLEDLQQLVLNPTPIMSEVLKMVAAKSASSGTSSAMSSSRMGTNSSGAGFDSPTLSTAHTKGTGDGAVQHLGVVGRGVKRVSMNPISGESGPTKKPLVEKGPDGAP
ncbi:Tetratricopeptide repeat (TPR)-like superfamily protein [Thalictrum thalictroides]|uniref:Tetratricopeptide repeat (TPR)-like superfamily protein n=1 Tax=Thalictrum thalictroides TaxID=46969 RepID=A0A7J6W321_THATH|nr:Tetratricopeptide repeat (TPR)-like superfamily protein [Thalictrum thalictroides]